MDELTFLYKRVESYIKQNYPDTPMRVQALGRLASSYKFMEALIEGYKISEVKQTPEGTAIIFNKDKEVI